MTWTLVWSQATAHKKPNRHYLPRAEPSRLFVFGANL
jgi:hypothetical protein